MGWKKVERERQWERPSATNHKDMGEGAQEKGLAGVGDTEHGITYKACGEKGWSSLKTGVCEDPSKWILLHSGGIPC